MPYKFVKGEDGVYTMKRTLNKETTYCIDCKIRKATRYCEKELSGILAGRLCNLPLCSRCAIEIENGRRVCGPHAALSKPKRKPPKKPLKVIIRK